jgi:prophage regulatory protein
MAHIEGAAAREAASDNLRRAVADKADRILRRREVLDRVGVGQSTLYDWMNRGAFPRPVALGSKMVGWRDSDVTAWIERREVRGAA